MKTLLKALLSVEEIPNKGICLQMDNYYGEVTPYKEWRHIRTIMGNWPEGTHSENFPVPHPEGSRVSGYFNAQRYGTTWEGEYGDNRRALLKYLINELEKECE